MKIQIEIPEEFEEHFDRDRFEDSLHRLSADAHLIAGRYEQETAVMLIKALKNAEFVNGRRQRRMANQEAIELIQERVDFAEKRYPDMKEYHDALVMAIAALKEKAEREESQARDDELFRALYKRDADNE